MHNITHFDLYLEGLHFDSLVHLILPKICCLINLGEKLQNKVAHEIQ